MLNKAQYLSNC